MAFDFDKLRQQLLEPFGIIRCLKLDLNEAHACHALHGHVFSLHHTAIECFVVGLNDSAYALLRKAKEFISLAISEKEIPNHYFPHYEEASRYYTLAQINWLLEDIHDSDNLAKAVEKHNLYYTTALGAKDNVYADLYMDAGAYKDFMGHFYRAKMKVPSSFTRIGKETTAAYWIARHHLVGDVTKEQMTTAVQALLRRFVPYWLVNNQFFQFARWMKIACWKPGDSAGATLLKCYDFVPCDPPAPL